jgi:hypothetical protein
VNGLDVFDGRFSNHYLHNQPFVNNIIGSPAISLFASQIQLKVIFKSQNISFKIKSPNCSNNLFSLWQLASGYWSLAQKKASSKKREARSKKILTLETCLRSRSRYEVVKARYPGY